jgi:regulator of replication initiation timing
MSDLSQIVGNLSIKVDLLIDKANATNAKNIDLNKENENLLNENNLLKLENNNLKEQIKIIKLAKSLSLSGQDTGKVKIKINELVKEIDKCISVMNK